MSVDAASHVSSLSPATPLGGWRRMVHDSLLVGGATVVCHAIGVATSLLLRTLLPPAEMGIWQGLKTFLSYANYANLGVSKGAVQELSRAQGRGNPAAAEHGLHLAHTANLVTSALYALGLLAAGVWFLAFGGGEWSARWGLGFMAVALLAVVQRHVTFHVTILRAKKAFAAASRISVWEAGLTLVASAVAIWLLGLSGVYVATLLVLLATWHLALRHGSQPLRLAWDVPEMRRLIGIGGPILAAGICSTLFRSLDRLMILAYCPDREEQLGCYSLALLATAQLFGLANMLSTVMGPRYNELLGRCDDESAVARLAARASEMQAATIALPAALAVVAGPALLGWLLPDYAEGLLPLRLAIPGAVAAGMALPASQFLQSVDRGRSLVWTVVLATALAAAGMHLALLCGGGLAGVAIAGSLANVFYWLLVLAVALWPRLPADEKGRYVVAMAGTLGLCLLTAVLIEYRWPSTTDDWQGVVVKSLLVTLVWCGASLAGWHRGGWKLAWETRR